MVARDCNPSTQKVEVGEAEVEGWDIQLELSFKERREKKKALHRPGRVLGSVLSPRVGMSASKLGTQCLHSFSLWLYTMTDLTKLNADSQEW